MAILEGKTPTERNKLIAAALLGLVALVSLYFAFFRSSSSTTTTATAKSSPTPSPKTSVTVGVNNASLPSAAERESDYQITEVVYPGNITAPDPGRNIFAFYEPPGPCGPNDTSLRCQTPIPSPPPMKSPSPTPTAPMQLDGVNPLSVYAGAKDFRMEVTGDRFTPEAQIYFNQSAVTTTFINSQKLVADIPAKYISTDGGRQVIVQTPDGTKYSNQLVISVMAPPKPAYTYIGMIGRKRYNNDTAYFTEGEKGTPFGARLNDVLGGRFRLVDIQPSEVVFEDTNLGFRHRIPISRAVAIGSAPPGRSSDLNEPGVPTYPPGFIPGQQAIPGIPNNIQPNVQGQEMRKAEQQKMEQQKKDVDDDGND